MLLSLNKVRQVASRSEYGCEAINKYSSYELNQTLFIQRFVSIIYHSFTYFPFCPTYALQTRGQI